jgi:hypothetical protein
VCIFIIVIVPPRGLSTSASFFSYHALLNSPLSRVVHSRRHARAPTLPLCKGGNDFNLLQPIKTLNILYKQGNSLNWIGFSACWQLSIIARAIA